MWRPWLPVLTLQLLACGVIGDDDDQLGLTLPGQGDPYKLKSPGDETSSLNGLYAMTRGFVKAVAPKEKMIDKIMYYGDESRTFDVSKDLMDILKMEAGFMVCLVAGLLLFFGLGLGGCFFCCCRCCCGNCGGKRVQEDRDNSNAKRQIYCSLLLVTIAFLGGALASAFLVSDSFRGTLPATEKNLIDGLDDMKQFFNSTAEQLHFLSYDGLQNVSGQIEIVVDELGIRVGRPIQEFCSKNINAPVNDMKSKYNEAQAAHGNLNETLLIVKSEIPSLSEDLKEIQKRLEEIEQTCKCGVNPNEVNFQDNNNVGSVNLEGFPTGILDKVDEALAEVGTIEDQIVTKTKETRKDLKGQLRNFTDSMNNSSFQVELRQVTELSNDFDKLKIDIKEVFKDVKENDKYRWYGMAGLAGLCTIPTALIFLGMLCGSAGHRKARHPRDRSCLSNCGGCSIVTGVYLLFFLSGIPVLVTTILFQAGGHIQAYGCDVVYEEDMASFDKLYEFLKTRLKINETLLERLTPSQTLGDCKNDSTVYKAFHLESVLNIRKELNFEEKMDLNSTLVDLKVEFSDVKIPSFKDYLKDFNDFTEKKEFKDLSEKLKGELIDSKALKKWFERLKSIAEVDDLKDNLTRFENKYDKFERNWLKLRNDYIPAFINRLNNLKDTVEPLEDNMKRVMADTKNEANRQKDNYTEGILSTARNYVNFVIDKVENDVGKCQQIWVVFDVARHVICRDVLDPTNGYWFSLGWFIFFSLFAIVFGSKLSKFYLRMSDMESIKRDDSSHNFEMVSSGSPEYRQEPPPAYNNGGYQDRGQFHKPDPSRNDFRNSRNNYQEEDRLNGWKNYQ